MIVTVAELRCKDKGLIINGEPSYFPGDLFEVKAVDTKFCCNRMRVAFDSKEIGFGAHPKTIYKNTDRCVMIWGKETSMAISNCPFCGEEIECHQPREAEYV